MLSAIKLQTNIIVKIVGVLLIFEIIGIFQSLTYTLSLYNSDPANSFEYRNIVYFLGMILPFIFLVQFFVHLRHSNKSNLSMTSRNHILFSIKNAFEQLKIYFLMLICVQVVNFAIDLFMWVAG